MWGDTWGQFVWGSSVAVPLAGPIGLGLLVMTLLAGGLLFGPRGAPSRSFWMFGLLVCVVPLVAQAAVTLPFFFANGEIADADEVNANFDALAEAVPAGLSCAPGSYVTGFDASGGLICAVASGAGSIVISDSQPNTVVSLTQPGTGQFGPRTVVRTISVPSSDYLVVASGNLLNMNRVVAACDLLAIRDSDGFEFTLAGANLTYGVLGTGVGGSFNTPAPLVGQLPVHLTPATIEYACAIASSADANPRSITGSSLHAISAVASSEQ